MAGREDALVFWTGESRKDAEDRAAMAALKEKVLEIEKAFHEAHEANHSCIEFVSCLAEVVKHTSRTKGLVAQQTLVHLTSALALAAEVVRLQVLQDAALTSDTIERLAKNIKRDLEEAVCLVD